ncbi:MAG: hypothetical protein ACI4J5_01120 [Oscillospiraceae bacterium]
MNIKWYDEIFNDKKNEQDPLQDMPYNSYSIRDVRVLAEKEKAFSREIMTGFFGKYALLSEKTDAETVRLEYGSRSGHTLSRGYYHPGDGMEMAVSNVGRGKLLKKAPSPDKDFFRYSFDGSGNMLCGEMISEGSPYYKEYIIRRDEREMGIVFCRSYSGYMFSHINMAVYDADEKLRITYRYMSRSIEDICLYDYDDSGRRISVSIIFNALGTVYDALNVYFYEYDENGILLGMRDKGGHFHSVKGKNARRYVTAPKVTAAMENILRSRENIPDDVYVISVYYELNEAEGTAGFYIGFNTEENYMRSRCESGDDRDARWNYAYWLQNDIPLFPENEALYIRYIESGGAQRLLVNAVKALRKSGVINELFKKDIPVVIHDLEYSPQDAKYNLDANGKKLLPQDFIDFCGGIYSWE